MNRDKRLLVNAADLRGDILAMQSLVDALCRLNTRLYLHNPKSVLPDRDGVDFTVTLAKMQHKLADELGAISVAIDTFVLNDA